MRQQMEIDLAQQKIKKNIKQSQLTFPSSDKRRVSLRSAAKPLTMGLGCGDEFRTSIIESTTAVNNAWAPNGSIFSAMLNAALHTTRTPVELETFIDRKALLSPSRRVILV